MTLNDRVEALLTARRGVWVNARELAEVGGFAAWRTRLSNVRRQRGLVIENRVRMERSESGRRYRVSEYRLAPLPFELAAQEGGA